MACVWDYPGEPVPIWILLKLETVSGSGISWDVCKPASRSRQITMPASFLQAGCPSCRPSNSMKPLKAEHTHILLMALFPGLPRWAGTRKVKPIWILRKQETVSGSGISWAICKSAPCSRQTTMPAPHHSVFYIWMPFLPPNQQRQSTEGTTAHTHTHTR